MRSLPTLALLLVALLSSCTEPNPNFQASLEGGGATCTPGERLCSGANLMVCVGGTPPRLELERVCPAPSSCQQGACVASGDVCQGTCTSGFVCSPFVVPGTTRLSTYCVQPVGIKEGGQPCTKNQDCQTGLCVGGGKVPVCFRSCSKTRECPSGLRCLDIKVTVNGVAGTVPACVP